MAVRILLNPAITDRPPTDETLLTWVQRELVPWCRSVRDVLNTAVCDQVQADLQGADAVAAGDLQLEYEGRVHVITGSTRINGINKRGASYGTRITLRFTNASAPPLTHMGTPGTGFSKMQLAWSGDIGSEASPMPPFSVSLRLYTDGYWYQDSQVVSSAP
jgi:hypothetical protein